LVVFNSTLFLALYFPNHLTDTKTKEVFPVARAVSHCIKMTTNVAPSTIPLLISNKEHQTTATFPVYNPATGGLIRNFSSASISDADLAISAAQKAFSSWKNVRPSKRRDIFLRAADILDSKKPELANYLVEETGATENCTDTFLYK